MAAQRRSGSTLLGLAALLLVAAAAWFLLARPLCGASQLAGQPVPSPRAPVATAEGEACHPGPPKRLVYPALGVDAPVEWIGLDRNTPADADGRRPIGNPTDPSRIGWYARGPQPGDGRGTVLVNGHTYRDGSAVFGEDFATRAKAGQVIQTVQDDGSVCSYRVDRVWPEVDATSGYPRIVESERLYDDGGPERLFVATCGGSWNAAAEDYDDITMLVASPIDRG